MPSRRGMLTSDITRSTALPRANSSASWPSAASTTPYPADCSVARTIWRIEVESSTVRMVLVIFVLPLSTRRSDGLRARGIRQLHDGAGNLVQRHHFAGGTGTHRRARHSPHHAARFVLCDGRRAGIAHFLQAARAVVA